MIIMLAIFTARSENPENSENLGIERKKIKEKKTKRKFQNKKLK